jgi:transaldolase / glucose-6-phosphate isomerase
MRDADVRDLRDSGAPLAEVDLLEPSALGAEFVRWEVATAVAGALLGINPFDEPNVQQAKDATRVLLHGYHATGALPAAPPDRLAAGGISLTLSAAARARLEGQAGESFLTLIQPGDYFALLAYLGPGADLAERLREIRVAVRERTKAATMFGYGPRYLHSTGQLHKGGPNSGVFLLISATPAEDLAIPGEAFSFGTLEQAQALGDFASLDATGRRALHVHLPAPDRATLHRVAELLLKRI